MSISSSHYHIAYVRKVETNLQDKGHLTQFEDQHSTVILLIMHSLIANIEFSKDIKESTPIQNLNPSLVQGNDQILTTSGTGVVPDLQTDFRFIQLLN